MPQKTPQKGARIGSFKPKRQKRQFYAKYHADNGNMVEIETGIPMWRTFVFPKRK